MNSIDIPTLPETSPEEPPLAAPENESVTHPPLPLPDLVSPQFLRTRREFELAMALFAMASLRNPQEAQVVKKIESRAQALADRYEDRGFFDPDLDQPYRIEEMASTDDVPSLPAPPAPPQRVPGPVPLDQRPVVAVGAGPIGSGAKSPPIPVGQGRPGSTYAGKAVVDCSNAPHKGSRTAPPQRATLRTPPSRPLRGG